MSPTAPTLITLSNQLKKAHRRIRELQAREAELRAVINELRRGGNVNTISGASGVKTECF